MSRSSKLAAILLLAFSALLAGYYFYVIQPAQQSPVTAPTAPASATPSSAQPSVKPGFSIDPTHAQAKQQESQKNVEQLLEHWRKHSDQMIPTIPQGSSVAPEQQAGVTDSSPAIGAPSTAEPAITHAPAPVAASVTDATSLATSATPATPLVEATAPAMPLVTAPAAEPTVPTTDATALAAATPSTEPAASPLPTAATSTGAAPASELA